MTTKPTVLFVDDEAHIVNLLKVMFRNDYEVMSATSGEGALDIIQTRKVHVIVSDQRMPGMLGTELLSKVRKLSPGTMRILLTGYSDLAAMVGSINEGEIYRFVSKPWNNDEIRALVREAAETAMSTETSPLLAVTESVPTSTGVDAGILVLDENIAQNVWFKEHFGPEFPIFTAETIDQALNVLEERDIGVVVTDTKVGGENTLSLLRVLKQQYPVVMTVMLTAHADSDAVLKMINQAQVCRLSFKPIKRGALDIAVKAAMMHHQRYRADPRLARRQRVDRSGEADTTLTQSLIGRLRGIGKRFGFRAQAA